MFKIYGCFVNILTSFSVGLLLLLSASFSIADDEYSSYEVAELILGIIHFTRWPDDQNELQLCILGQTDHADLLSNNQLAVGKFVVDGRVVEESEVFQQLNSCQVFFFGKMSLDNTHQLYTQLYSNPVLTIDEMNDACRVGGMFCLHYYDNKLGFKVNLDAIGRSQVRVHPGVLRLGQRRLSE